MSRIIDYIIIHEADCPLHKPSGAEFTIKDIDQWHKERGFKRQPEWIRAFNSDLKAVGYHFVINITGTISTGRHVEEIPAACQGNNHDSINICLIGKGKYTSEQWTSLAVIVKDLCIKYPNAKIKGHYEMPTGKAQGKTCPDFPVSEWVTNGMQPIPEHTT
jgi:N-acetyl-anhydromuramyl-L-alanine amidase AmpD